ncbi:hypothetical protein HG530_014659 [Fusarium avenaceum]|nr:hypothetical protein HG530_014659 [Fusarium avenaceum]
MATAFLFLLPAEILDIVARQKNLLGPVDEETPTKEANVGYLRTTQRHRGTNTDEGGTLWDEDDCGCIAE